MCSTRADKGVCLASDLEGPIELVDCGAEIGLISVLLAARCPGLVRIRAFEPNERVFPFLASNLHRLPVEAEAHRAGLGDFDGTGILKRPEHDRSDHARFVETKSAGDFPVLKVDDVGFIRRLRGALRPGGSLVLKVPAGPWLYSSLDQALGHHRRYTRRCLARTYRAGGYALSLCRPFNTVGILGWFVNGCLLGRKTPPAMQLSAFETLLPVSKLIDRLNPLPIGVSLIATGTELPTAAAE